MAVSPLRVRPDPTQFLRRVADALAADDQPQASFVALDHALAEAIGHKLFTILVVNLDADENQRCYSSQPVAYPVGGAKKIVRDSESARTVIFGGRCKINRNYAELSAAFYDHELIRSLGCESSINVPVRWNGRTLGMLNLLHESEWYGEADIPTLSLFAALAVPSIQRVIDGWPKR